MNRLFPSSAQIRRTGYPKAFTLVELLVVIGIIALLISVLLPALSKARETAKRIACAAQLHSIGIATFSYAADNKDALPPMNYDDGSAGYDCNGTPSAPIYNQFARSIQWPVWQNGGADPLNEIGKPAIGSGIGRLVLRKNLAGNFFKNVQCPSTLQAQGGVTWSEYSCYAFNVHPSVHTYTPGNLQLVQPMWTKLSKYGRSNKSLNGYSLFSGSTTGPYNFGGRSLALACDPMLVPNTYASIGAIGAATHNLKSQRAYNLLYADGSVQTGIVPNTYLRGGPINGWARFLDVLGYAEFSVAGKAQLAVGNGGYATVPYNANGR